MNFTRTINPISQKVEYLVAPFTNKIHLRVKNIIEGLMLFNRRLRLYVRLWLAFQAKRKEFYVGVAHQNGTSIFIYFRSR